MCFITKDTLQCPTLPDWQSCWSAAEWEREEGAVLKTYLHSISPRGLPVLCSWMMWRQRAPGAAGRGNAPTPIAQPASGQGLMLIHVCRLQVKIQRYHLMKAKGNEMFCLGDFRYRLSSLYSLSPDFLPKPFSCMVLINKGLVSVQYKHV